jgi:hypothetical protein
VTWHEPALYGRRRARGVTTVEYVLLVTAVFIPSLLVATTCFVHLVGWYADFVGVVSRPRP